MSFDHMSTPRDGPNPLRPYYIPPSIGFGNDIDPIAKNASSPSYTSSARDIFSDIDYTDYVSDSSSSTLASLRALLDQAMYKYTSVLLAQPFEVAKTILQVRTQAGGSEAITLVNNDIRNRESYRNGDSSDVSVKSCSGNYHMLNLASIHPTTIRILMNQLTSPLLPLQSLHTLLLDHGGGTSLIVPDMSYHLHLLQLLID